MVECNLAKVDVEGSNPFSRSEKLKQNQPVRGPALAGFFRLGPTCGGQGATKGATGEQLNHLGDALSLLLGSDRAVELLHFVPCRAR